MENAQLPLPEEPSVPGQAATILTGAFPHRKNTVIAEVLCRVLNREKLTSLDAVRTASTTRAAAVVYALTRGYGWPIRARPLVVQTADGRHATVAEYYLSDEVIEAAALRGSHAWCADVVAARAAQRQQGHRG